MIRHCSVYVATGLICLAASVVHADAAQDLMSALGLTSASPIATPLPSNSDATGIDTMLVASSTDATISLPDPEMEKKKQIAELRALVKTLTARLKALIAAKKAAVASLSDTTEICSIKRSLGRGMKGEDVKALQKFLVSESELDTQLISGSFGATTEEAVQQWQMHNGIVSYGSPETTGYGYVGKATLAVIQQNCTKSTKGGFIDPALAKNSNMQATTTWPQQVRVALSIDGSAFKRGMKIPVRITVQDPIPYLGADIEFMQTTSKGSNTFGNQIYLPVGFTGQVTHYINASHIEVEGNDKSFGTSEIPLNAIVEAQFRDPNDQSVTGRDMMRTFGTSDQVRVFISEDTSSGHLVYTVNGVEGDKSGDIKSDFGKFFVATTTSRATSIEYCDLLSQVVSKNAKYSCRWGDEELSDVVKDKKKTIPAGPTGRTLGLYSMFMGGAISETQLSVSREDALSSCGRTHTGSPTSPITCVWENEIIYDNGGLDDPPPQTYTEPGAAPISL